MSQFGETTLAESIAMLSCSLVLSASRQATLFPTKLAVELTETVALSWPMIDKKKKSTLVTTSTETDFDARFVLAVVVTGAVDAWKCAATTLLAAA